MANNSDCNLYLHDLQKLLVKNNNHVSKSNHVDASKEGEDLTSEIFNTL
jgi:hypothetical protein